MTAPIVIVGAGQAAASFISRHITLGSAQPLLLIGDESHPPYQRPPLSKKYLLGELERERLFIRPLEWYAGQGVVTRFDTRVSSIKPADKQIVTETGESESDRIRPSCCCAPVPVHVAYPPISADNSMASLRCAALPTSIICLRNFRRGAGCSSSGADTSASKRRRLVVSSDSK